jgi:hypothetical protein
VSNKVLVSVFHILIYMQIIYFYRLFNYFLLLTLIKRELLVLITLKYVKVESHVKFYNYTKGFNFKKLYYN